MKTGIELIAEERQEQITKHGRTIEQDVALNYYGQLSMAASRLIYSDGDGADVGRQPPPSWDSVLWSKMYNKPYYERLVIAGALIAAEIDRINRENIQFNPHLEKPFFTGM